MKDLLILLLHLLITIAKLLGPGGAKAVVADSMLMKQQLLVINRSRRRAPNLSALDRYLFGCWSLFLDPHRIQRAAVIIRPSTLSRFHKLLKQRKYRRLFSTGRKAKPGPKGPSRELIQAIVAMKQRNPRFGCPRIAQQIKKALDVDINKDVVRRILAAHYRPGSGNSGPSWLSFLGHTKDSLWSIDLFRCESIHLRSHWVLVVMDQFTRRIVGFGVHAGDVDGIALCHMFNTAIFTQGAPHRLSSDNDPLFRYHRWLANLRILEIQEIKTVPYVPLSHPFIERLIGPCAANSLTMCSSGMPMTWSENWKNSDSTTMRFACTLRSTVTHHQQPLVKPPAAVLTSTDSSGNRIAAGCTSCL